MNTTEEKIAVMQAFNEGKKIQLRRKSVVAPDWHDTRYPAWDWWNREYRVKPDIAPGHNPEEIAPEQVGKGWRLLTEEEFEKVTFLDGEEPEYWDLDWVAGGAANPEDRSSLLTYRTNLPEWWLRLPVAYRVLARKNLDEELGLDARDISYVFLWKETPEGAEFWAQVARWLDVGGELPPLPTKATLFRMEKQTCIDQKYAHCLTVADCLKLTNAPSASLPNEDDISERLRQLAKSRPGGKASLLYDNFGCFPRWKTVVWGGPGGQLVAYGITAEEALDKIERKIARDPFLSPAGRPA